MPMELLLGKKVNFSIAQLRHKTDRARISQGMKFKNSGITLIMQ
jgi:hypothetical protein